MIISFISYKGGVGKSILSQNTAVTLADRHRSVLLVETDPNGSTERWNDVREEQDIDFVREFDEQTITRKLITYRQDYDFVIVDCPPAINPITTRVLLISDLSVIPIATTGGNDLWGMEGILEHIQQLKRKANVNVAFVVNRFRKNIKLHLKIAKALQDYARQYKIPILQTIVAERAVYGEANADGCGVIQYNNRYAADEMRRLTNEIIN